MKKRLLLIILSALGLSLYAQQNMPQPNDPAVRHGVLDNGLTYYIRHNKFPAQRADFFFAQKVGSVQEEDSQLGLAHFLEHMAFNGTTNFPGNSMLNYLETIGVKFALNANAYTSFDETVYNLSNVPITREGVIDSCLLIMHDWSGSLLLEEKDIEKERGVIREEWRTRGGAQYRIWEKMFPEIYKGSRYANRMPIGDINIVNNCKQKDLHDYYKKWYRPDLQGVIVVGDFDADIMERKVKELFSKIAMPENPAERIFYTVPNNDEPLISVVTDTESSRTNIMLSYKHDILPYDIKFTEAGVEIGYIKYVASKIINERFQEIAQKSNSPFVSAISYDGNFMVSKTKDAWNVVATSAEDKAKEALEAMLRETERIKRYGFTESEYERARLNLLKEFENDYNNRDKQNNYSYVQQYLRSFNNITPFPGIEYDYMTLKKIAPQIPLSVINANIKELITDKNIVLAINGPEKKGLIYPTKKELLEIITAVKTEKIDAYKDAVSNITLIEEIPTAGSIISENRNEILGTTEWVLSNNMKVVIKKTDFKDDEIIMKGTSEGGTSRFFDSPDTDMVNIKMMGSFMNIGGIGNFDIVSLHKALAGKTASAYPIIDLTTQSIGGASSVADFEAMLQLVYLYFTSPREDSEAFNAQLERMQTQMKNVDREPRVALSDTISKIMYGDNPYMKRVKHDDLKKMNYKRIREMYKESFKNPGSFTFTFVGNIDEEAIKPYVLQYLASIKGEEKTEFKKVDLSISKGKHSSKFEKEMKLPKSTVYNIITGEIERNQKNSLTMSIMTQILDLVYTEKVREKEGGTYGVRTTGSISRYPENRATLNISYDTDPEKAEYLNEIVIRELETLAEKGPQQVDFDKSMEFMLKNRDESIKENRYWLGILNRYYLYGEDVHTNYIETLKSISTNDVQRLAQELIAQGNILEIIMSPKR